MHDICRSEEGPNITDKEIAPGTKRTDKPPQQHAPPRLLNAPLLQQLEVAAIAQQRAYREGQTSRRPAPSGSDR
ncbi:hypothetical protein CGGC5_v001023 [Colletotrichum fructicola Nara gc5]|uniref:Uncharacterized protein n=1 Tax=Colletotrichum fructicola (strain Nara gc5) TaxID=1213859 RepID=A0A7J6JJ08_COLFN|nr:hypothetical protein CGGC5_v001023 [Colletotrichum fructicola Nara gc5]